MAWENYKVEHQRLLLINEYLQKETSMTDLCKKFGVSRKTAYKWVDRFKESGQEGLQNLSRAPHNANQRFTPEQIDIAIDLKHKHRNWGPKKVLARLEELYPQQDWPSPTRLYEIFKDYHLVTRKRVRARIPATAPLGTLTSCNDTWAVDFKGWFLTGDGFKCEPLTISDCYSRYLIRCIHLPKHTVEHVWPVFADTFREFGLPNRVRSDNGPPFGSVGVARLTGLSVNLIKAGVTPEWIRPGHPEENGRHERLHLTLKQDAATPPKGSLVEQINALHEFQQIYNFERPHEALNMKTPASCYYYSSRSWNGILRSPEYDRREMDARKVCQSGCIWLKQKEYYIGQALTGEYVGLKEINEGMLELYFGPVYLGLINTLKDKGLEKPKLKTRRQR
jgi:transposase InsO family protein